MRIRVSTGNWAPIRFWTKADVMRSKSFATVSRLGSACPGSFSVAQSSTPCLLFSYSAFMQTLIRQRLVTFPSHRHVCLFLSIGLFSARAHLLSPSPFPLLHRISISSCPLRLGTRVFLRLFLVSLCLLFFLCSPLRVLVKSSMQLD